MDTKEIISSIFQYGNQYFNSSDIKKLYNQEIEFRFAYGDSEEVNAYIQCILDENQNTLIAYKIVFYTGLVKKLEQHAQFIAQKYEKIDLEKRHKFATFLLFMWLHFVIFHEFGHAICGHLKYDLANSFNVKKWYELDKLDKSSKSINQYPNLDQAMELEADAQATKFLLQPFFEIYNNYSIDLYGKLDNDALWYDFLFSILSLFEFFESLNPNDDGVHPFPFIRVYACLMTLIGELNYRPELLQYLPNLNLEKFEEHNSSNALSDYFTEKFIDFNCQQNKLNLANKTNIEIFIKRQEFAFNFCAKVDDIIQKANLSEFRLIKTKF